MKQPIANYLLRGCTHHNVLQLYMYILLAPKTHQMCFKSYILIVQNQIAM